MVYAHTFIIQPSFIYTQTRYVHIQTQSLNLVYMHRNLKPEYLNEIWIDNLAQYVSKMKPQSLT